MKVSVLCKCQASALYSQLQNKPTLQILHRFSNWLSAGHFDPKVSIKCSTIQYIIWHVTMATYPSWYSNDAGVSWADWVVSTNGIVQDCLNVTQWAAGGSVKHMETDTSPTCTLPSCVEKWYSNHWILLQPDQVRTLMSPNNGKTVALSFAWWMPEEVIAGWNI